MANIAYIRCGSCNQIVGSITAIDGENQELAVMVADLTLEDHLDDCPTLREFLYSERKKHDAIQDS